MISAVRVYTGNKNEKLRSQISEGTTLNAPAISKPTKKTIAYNVEGLDLADIYSNIHIQIVKWLQLRTETKLRQLVEHEHYEVVVQRSSGQRGFFAAVTCKLCDTDKKITLQVDKNTIKLSNWYKHVKACINKKDENDKKLKRRSCQYQDL